LNSHEPVEYTLRFLEGGPGRDGWMSWYFIRGRELIGLGVFADLPAGGSVVIGYSLEQYQRQDFATKAMSALTDCARILVSRDPDHCRADSPCADRFDSHRRAPGLHLRRPGSEEGAIGYTLQPPSPRQTWEEPAKGKRK
jgi:hypothetical protein